VRQTCPVHFPNEVFQIGYGQESHYPCIEWQGFVCPVWKQGFHLPDTPCDPFLNMLQVFLTYTFFLKVLPRLYSGKNRLHISHKKSQLPLSPERSQAGRRRELWHDEYRNYGILLPIFESAHGNSISYNSRTVLKNSFFCMRGRFGALRLFSNSIKVSHSYRF